MIQLPKGAYAGSVAKASTQKDDGFIACVTSYTRGGFNNDWHYHENAHFSFVLDGGCIEKKNNDYELIPGSITYYHAGEVHQVVRIAKPLRRVNIELDNQFFRKFELTDDQVSVSIMKNPDAKFLLVKAYRELIVNDDLSLDSVKILLLDLIHRNETHKGKKGVPEWVYKLKEYITSKKMLTATLDELSKVANVHPVTISKSFPLYFNSTLGEYIRKLKVERAIHLLKTTDFSLTDIALECGFYDQSHFIRNFKLFTGYLPSGYQKL